MLVKSDGLRLESAHGLTITARLQPDEGHRVDLRLAGDIDMASYPILAQTVDWLTELAPASVLVDLAGLTFACATLPNFVVQVRQGLPDNAELILWRAKPMTAWLLRITDMATIATVHEKPTAPPDAPV